MAVSIVSRAGDLGAPLRRACALYGARPALAGGPGALSYAELAARVARLGAALDELEVTPGGRVAYLGVNSTAHLECWLGVPAAGRVLVDLNTRLADAELRFMIEDCEPEVLIVDAANLERGRALRAACRSVRALVLDGGDAQGGGAQALEEGDRGYEALLAAASPTPHEPVAGGDALAAISYTGGTTGTPKGVMLSHANLLANALHNLVATGHGPGDVWLHVCPMFHVAGTSNVFAATWAGARQVVLPRFEAAAVADAIARDRVTHLVLVPTMLAMLLDELERRPVDLSSLRHVQYAASPISPELQRRVIDRLPCEVVQFYGMTEAAPTVSRLSGEDHARGRRGEAPHDRRLRSIGAPVIGVEAVVRGLSAEAIPAGEVGEVYVRGPNVMLGYWRRESATAAVLDDDGWYHTGDAAYADEDGYLYVVDRLKDMVVSGGENVYCGEVEAALGEHPDVVEAAVFGVPDPRWGERVHAVVRLDDAAVPDSARLEAHLRARLAGYKVPRSIEFSPDPLPRSAAGKVLKTVLREPFWAGHERRVS